MKLHHLLGLPAEERRVVSLCGGGGKTTLMFALARESREKANTALFTTTHIFPPTGEDITLLEPFSEEKCRALWNAGKIVSAGTWQEGDRKFTAPCEDTAAFLCREGTGIYIEADGAHCLPVKYPAAWEPVLRPETTHTIVVAGLSALDKNVETVFHRLDLARRNMDIKETVMTEEFLARVLWAGYGRFSPVFFLNQADTPELASRGEKTAALLREYGAGKIVTASLHSLLS